MKACPNCRYLWPDEHTGQCSECGNPMQQVAANGSVDLGFRFARQVQDGQRETASEGSLRGAAGSPRALLDAYARVPVDERVMNAARGMIVQREEVRYEDD